MSGGQIMVVLIVMMVVIGRLIAHRMGHSGRRRDRHPARINDGESERLREEVRALKERLAVLERIATDGSTSLERQIEALRDHRDAPRERENGRTRDDGRDRAHSRQELE